MILYKRKGFMVPNHLASQIFNTEIIYFSEKNCDTQDSLELRLFFGVVYVTKIKLAELKK